MKQKRNINWTRLDFFLCSDAAFSEIQLAFSAQPRRSNVLYLLLYWAVGLVKKLTLYFIELSE